MKSKRWLWLRVGILLAMLAAMLIFRHQLSDLLGVGRAEPACTPEAAVEVCQKLAQDTYEYEHRFLGIRMQQFPNDLMLYQRLLDLVKPDVVIELGTLDGGLTHYLSMLLEHIQPAAKIITVDIDGSGWRKTVATTPRLAALRERIVFVEGDTLNQATIDQVAANVPEGARVVALLDTVHTKDHVLKELRAYERFLAPGGYFIVNDTHHDAYYHVAGPAAAVAAFLSERTDFALNRSFNRFFAGTCVHDGFLVRIPPGAAVPSTQPSPAQ